MSSLGCGESPSEGFDLSALPIIHPLPSSCRSSTPLCNDRPRYIFIILIRFAEESCNMCFKYIIKNCAIFAENPLAASGR